MEQISLFEYEDIKSRIKAKLNETVNNFVVIGFYLKQVRDNMLYIQDGYKNMEEFARGEYNLSASTASRFMDINTRFSEGGNSLILKMEYSNFGYSKLQEMLTVREEDLELITEDTTVKQIRELKMYEKQEEKAAEQEAQNNLPIVQLAAEEEETEEDAASQEDPFHAVMIEYWRNRVENLKRVHSNMISPEDLAEELCPSGNKMFYHGIYMIFLYDINGGIKVRHYQDGKPQIDTYTYAEWIDKTNEIINDEIFEMLTKPVQKEEPEPVVEEVKKEWKEAEVEVKEQKKEKIPVPAVEEVFQPLKGQTTVEDIPGVVPEEYKETAADEEQNRKDEYSTEYFCTIAEANEALRNEQYGITMEYLHKAIEIAKYMQEFKEKQ